MPWWKSSCIQARLRVFTPTAILISTCRSTIGSSYDVLLMTQHCSILPITAITACCVRSLAGAAYPETPHESLVMLKFLSIRNFVIVDRMELEFASGFTVLTGETGAGKSVLIDALSLVMGGRGDADAVRHGCERAEISAEFDIQGLPKLAEWLDENGFDSGGHDIVCLMRRTVDIGGRSRAFINGHSATLQQLRAAGEKLVDIHGQHAHQAMLRSDAQRDLLDAFSGNVELAR